MSLPNSLRSFSLFIIAFIVIWLALLPRAYAQGSFSADTSLNPDVVRNEHTRVQIILIELSSALICQLTGYDVINPEQGCLGIDYTTNKLGYAPKNSDGQIGGLLGFSTNMISSLYTPPVTSGLYVQYMAQNFGIGEKIYAASGDEGFNALESLRNIWVLMRNIAYLSFTIIFIIVGIAIMLRIKIDPRTVMSIQNQIPKIIIAIVLVTFSYAIVGVMIDLMWAVTYAGINILATKEEVDVTQDDMLILDPNGEAAQALKNRENNALTEDQINGLVQGSRNRESELRRIWADQRGLKPNDSEITKMVEKRVEDTAAQVTDLLTKVNTDGNQLSQDEIITIINDSWNNNVSVRQVATSNLHSTPFSYMKNLFSQAGGFGSFDGISGLSYDAGFAIGGVVSETVSSILGLDRDPECGGWKVFSWLLPWQLGKCLEESFLNIIKWFVGLLGFLIVGAAILIALARVWFSLLRALVYIIIYTIVGPLMIAAGLFPGSSLNFSRWFRAVLAHLLIFPVTVFAFLLARIMAANYHLNNPTGTTFLPPLIANPNSFDNFGTLIAFGIILVTPELLTFVRDALKAKPGPVAGILRGGFATGAVWGTALPRKFWRRLTEYNPQQNRVGAIAGFTRMHLPTILKSRYTFSRDGKIIRRGSSS